MTDLEKFAVEACRFILNNGAVHKTDTDCPTLVVVGCGNDAWRYLESVDRRARMVEAAEAAEAVRLLEGKN